MVSRSTASGPDPLIHVPENTLNPETSASASAPMKLPGPGT
jgi:hypothetical protein